jgi:hypothetical protein
MAGRNYAANESDLTLAEATTMVGHASPKHAASKSP